MNITSQVNNILWFRVNSALRQFIVRGGVRAFSNHYIVNEYPKSGGSWLGQMLSEALDVPFPRNSLPYFSSSIMHGHYLHPWNMENTVVLWRDGRDIIVSQYYHSLFKNEKGNSRLVDLFRREFKVSDYDDITSNLPAFIEFVNTKKLSPRFNWTQFVEYWVDEKAVSVKYEDLRMDTSTELSRIIKELTGLTLNNHTADKIADSYSFEKQSGRTPGQEVKNSFMRKGIIGDWKNYFSGDAREVFNYYAGEALIKLDYEKNNNWVTTHD